MCVIFREKNQKNLISTFDGSGLLTALDGGVFFLQHQRRTVLRRKRIFRRGDGVVVVSGSYYRSRSDCETNLIKYNKIIIITHLTAVCCSDADRFFKKFTIIDEENARLLKYC